METLAALGGCEPATAGSVMMEETRVLTILLAVLGVELLLLLSTLLGGVGVGQTLSFIIALALSFAILALALTFGRRLLPFLLLPALLPPLLLVGVALATPAASVLAGRATGRLPLCLASDLLEPLVRLLSVCFHLVESLLLQDVALARRICAVAQQTHPLMCLVRSPFGIGHLGNAW